MTPRVNYGRVSQVEMLKKREEILQILKQAKVPLSMKEIKDRFVGSKPETSVKALVKTRELLTVKTGRHVTFKLSSAALLPSATRAKPRRKESLETVNYSVPRMTSNREGAFDFLNLPSLVQSSRVSYQPPIAIPEEPKNGDRSSM